MHAYCHIELNRFNDILQTPTLTPLLVITKPVHVFRAMIKDINNGQNVIHARALEDPYII